MIWKMEARIMCYNSIQIIFLSKEVNIVNEVQNDMVQLFVMPSFLKVAPYHE